MIPMKDLNPRHRTPYVTIALIIANVIIFFFEPLNSEAAFLEFADRWALIPKQLLDNFGSEAFTLITSTFLHGGLLHLGSNMLYLWIFGDNIEDKLGHGRFLIFYLICGILAGFAQIAVDPSSAVPNVGASGAVAGVLGAYFLLFPAAKVVTMVPILLFRRFQLPAWILLGLWFATQLLSGLPELAVGTGNGGVAFWAHIGGFVAGVLLVKLIGNTKKLDEIQINYLEREKEDLPLWD